MKILGIIIGTCFLLAADLDAARIRVRHRQNACGSCTTIRMRSNTPVYAKPLPAKPCGPVCCPKPCPPCKTKPCPPKCEKPKCEKPADSVCPKCPGKCPEGKPCPPPKPKKQVIHSQAQACLVIVNQHRARAGLNALRINANLSNLCNSHCQRQANSRRMFHSSFGMRENVAMGPRHANGVMSMWMNSRGHRANILSRCSEIGIGEYNGYWTMILR